MASGVNLDITFTDNQGSSLCAAHSILIACDAAKPETRLVVVAATKEFLLDVEAEFKLIAGALPTTPKIAIVDGNSSVDKEARVILMLANEVGTIKIDNIQFVAICEVNAIFRFEILSGQARVVSRNVHR